MTTTGWTGETPEAERPAMPVTEMLLQHRQREPGDALEMALARSRAAEARQLREEAASRRDPDDAAAALVNRGYTPGLLSQLSMRLADVTSELADEEAKIEKAAQRAERTRLMHERGQIDAAGIAARWRDTDEGDEGKVVRLRRRADSLRQQIAEASAMIAPAEQRMPTDPLEAATSRAHAAFVEATRAQLAGAQVARPGPRPFAYVSRSAGVECAECVACDCTPEESFLIHHSDANLRPVSVPAEADRSAAPGPELTRVASADGMAQLGTLFGEAVR